MANSTGGEKNVLDLRLSAIARQAYLHAELLQALAEVADHLGHQSLHGRHVHDFKGPGVHSPVATQVLPHLQMSVTHKVLVTLT